MRLFPIYDYITGNGKTTRESNLERQHRIPIGTLVEVKYDHWYGEGACEKVHARLFVVLHDRDCDGTPMYALGHCESVIRATGIPEESLTPLEMTPLIYTGDDALKWED